jgi:SPP1 gp7 family putative phage head morphogenesis protein
VAPPEPPADPDRFDEAIRAFRRLIPVTEAELANLIEAERARAFWVAGVTEARLVQEVVDAIDRAIANGTTLDTFKDEVGGRLAEAWGGDDPARLETVFRTNVMTAYNAGRQEVFADPEVRKARPYLRFDAVGDSRTSDICDALDGTVLPADDPFWRTHSPPLHHQCRSILTPLTAEEAGEEGVGRPETKGATPEEGFGRPADPENWEPDIAGFDPEIRKVLKDRLR